ncbi:restriction endonuclease subunit S [Rheinheimera marina]|uniref:Restriction endonuclease subunit S n=1 Tax=Rheinheimera marina TaxID=1774958 RepID=A0ABV9JJ22_9GAMM
MSFEPQNWPLVKLSDLITVKHGFAFKGEFFSDEPTELQLTTPGNFAIGGGFQLGKGKFYSGEYPKEYVLKNGDLIVTMTDLSKAADTLGYAAMVPETEGTIWLHNQRVGLVQIKKDAPVELDFLHYLMRTADYRHWVVSTATGSTVKHTSPSRICDYEFRLPPIWLQGEIGRILTAHDDRITLLRETNATLEAIAQALFKSWFVDFDPVHANAGTQSPSLPPEIQALFPATFTDSPQGPIPEGWSWITLDEAYEINPKRLLKKGVVAKYLDMASVQTQGHVTGEVIDREFGSGTKFCNGDTLLARITPCLENGKTAFVDFLEPNETGWGSTEFVVLKPKAPLPDFHGYLLARQSVFREFAIRSMSGTSGRQRVQNDVLGSFNLAIPDKPIATAFSQVVTPIQQSISANHKQAKTLAHMRDTLLPRLISGQLRLPEAQAAIEGIS